MVEWTLIAVTPIFFIFGVLAAERSKVRDQGQPEGSGARRELISLKGEGHR